MAAQSTPRTVRLVEGDVEVSVRPFGPTADQLAALGARAQTHRVLRERFAAGARLVSVAALDDEAAPAGARPQPPSRYRLTLWDAERGCAVHAEGELAAPGRLTISESATVPPPSAEEYQEAVRLVTRDRTLGKAVRDGDRVPYRPIPAVQVERLPDGRIERRVAVGLLPRARGARHEIVGVDLDRRRVMRSADLLPANARPATTGLCGVPVDAEQETASQGTAGQVWVTVSQAGRVLWRFLAVRPAASSGTNGSGIELRYVDYLGKRVLRRAHVPILNVKYDGDACGPYRDWQFEEGMIQAQGTDAGPGFRLCPTPAQTIMDTGSDTGTFLGVGIYLSQGELVLVSELQAGWYRYLSEWRLGLDGVIRPRFGFAAVESQCVCNVHHHHAYWRFDFAIRTSAHNRVLEFNDPPLSGRSRWQVQRFEVRRRRDPVRNRKWRVENTASGEGYEIVPGADDGVAATQPDAPFGRGDVWILRYRGSEIDDGVVATGPPFEAGLNAWLTGEPVHDHDLVLWYGAHFTHDVNEIGPAQHGHLVGPDLRPVGW
jgi:hypothetical protein